MDWGIFRPSRPTAVCLVLLILSFLLMTFRLTRTVQAFRSFLFYWISPSYETVSTTVRAAGGLSSRFSGLVMAHRENETLKEKMKNYPLVAARLEEALLENQRLRQILNLESSRSFGAITAFVFGRDPQNWVQSVWIDRGTREGVQTDCPVLAVRGDPVDDKEVRAGVIGRVLECGPNSSKVLLISDPLSSLAATLTRTGEECLLQGHGSFLLTVEYLNQTADVQVGDEVVTSGLGGIFPPGLAVGKIARIIDSSSGFKRAELIPEVSLSRVKEVLILKKNGF